MPSVSSHSRATQKESIPMKNDGIFHSLKVRALALATHAVGVVLGAPVDTRGYEEVEVCLDLGTVPGGATIDVQVLDTDDLANPFVLVQADPAGGVPGATAVFAQKTAADSDGLFFGRINMREARRYLRVQANVAGSAVPASVTLRFTEARVKPARDRATADFIVC